MNRQYQRKLVWTVSEKQRLVDSILQGYPLPLFLLAERPSSGTDSVLEVIDGMQRLNAIFGFIENSFLYEGKCFDVNEFARARQLADSGIFQPSPPETPKLEAALCSNVLDYQLAVTIFPGEGVNRITDVFGRINSGGKQLSDQERRQAGVISPFAEVVRELSAEIRGDVSREELPLAEMPEISIETSKNVHGYKLRAEEIFWCYQGILRTNHLRDSEDEQIIADLIASVVYGEPIEASGEFLNKLYDPTQSEYTEVNSKLSAYPRERLVSEIKTVFSVVRNVIEASSTARFHFRDTVYPKPTSNAQKQAFIAVFLAIFDLIMREGKVPSAPEKIMPALNDMTKSISVGQKHIKSADRQRNIKIVKGMIADSFVKGDVAALGHGPGLVFDFENSIRRSRTETTKYEFKQGILRLHKDRKVDEAFLTSLIETVCGIANSGPGTDGFIYLGIADKPADAKRVEQLDGIAPVPFEHVQIVGIDREAKVLDLPMDKYVNIIEKALSHAQLSEPLKTQVRTSIDVVLFKGVSVLRLRIPAQQSASFVGDQCFYRTGSSTFEAKGPQIAAIARLFG